MQLKNKETELRETKSRKRINYERANPERVSERQAEETRRQRLLSVLARKLAAHDESRKPRSKAA
jgi:hypothetical protein